MYIGVLYKESGGVQNIWVLYKESGGVNFPYKTPLYT